MSTSAPETRSGSDLGAALTLQGVHADVGGQHVLQGVDLDVGPGEFIALVGHNGAGKSTLLRTIMRLVRAQSGIVALDGKSLEGLSIPQVKARGVSLVPQQRGYFENLSVAENLDMATTGGRIALEDIYETFPVLRERRRQLVGTMSGGQRQMVAISLALLGSPRLLMLDEPSVGLQPNLVQRVMEVSAEINRTYGITVVLVEQNIEKALAVAHRVAVLNRGRVALDRPTSEVAVQDIWDLL
jgi:branched-chain amino acid transport system ATP-binding protein